jgi:serine/threonine protein kinase/WD40 repeat protein
VEVTEGSLKDVPQGSDHRDEVELLADEFLARRRRGENPTVQEYADRRPDLAAAIRAVFPILVLVEELGGEPSSTGASGPGLPGAARHASPAEAAGEAAGLRQVGEYRILREIGRGGMGIVYEAVQESLDRRVALKVLPLHSLLGPKHLERFQHEARAAARVSHPNIVPIFGVGEHLGLHYFVMQYIPGQGLDRVIEEVRRLRDGGSAGSDSGIADGLSSPGGRERYYQNAARIARDAALALDHAHREGVLHRDVKPSNLILDPTGHIWLADFGLAKSVDGEELTRTGDFLGTFRYMAPERFKGWADPRSDVYALGLTLYELLALRPAFAERNRERLLRKLATEDPTPLRRIDRSIPQDLETIVIKASAREPVRRYASAQAMADDLDCYLRGQPIAARRSTPLGRLKRWCARNPAVASLAAVVLLLLVTVAAVCVTSYFRVAREQAAGREKLRDSYLAQAQALRFSGRPGQRFGALKALAEAAKIRSGPDLRDEAAASIALDDVRELASWSKDKDAAAFFDAELRRVALTSKSGAVVIRDLQDDREVLKLPGLGVALRYVYALFHPDGRHLAIRYHGDRLNLWKVWDLERKAVVATMDDAESTDGIDFDPRDGSIVVATRDGALRTLELSSGRVLSECRLPFRIEEVAVHPGGELVAVTRFKQGKEAYIADRTSGRIFRALSHPSQPSDVAWHPGGRFLAASCHDRRVYLWDAETGELQWLASGHEAEVAEVRFHPAGTMLVSAGWENNLHFWDSGSGRRLFILQGKQGTFSADGRYLGINLTLGYEKHELSPAGDGFTLHGHSLPGAKHPHGVALAPGRCLAASWGDDGVRIWDLITRDEVAHLPGGRTNFAEFDDAGANLITAGHTGLYRWPIRARAGAGRRRMILGPADVLSATALRRAAYADAAREVACLGMDGRIHLIALDEPEARRKLEDAPALETIALSPDGRWVAAGSTILDRSLLWSAADGKLLRRLDAPHGNLQFDPQARYLAVGAVAEYVLLETEGWKPVRRIPRRSNLPYPPPIAFDRGGVAMAIAGADYRIWLLEVESGRRLVELEAPDPRTLNYLALDVGAGVLAASSLTQRLYVWDLHGVAHQLGALGLSWDVQLPARPSVPREPLVVEVAASAATLGLLPDLEDPRASPLFRDHRRALFQSSIDSYGGLDAVLAAPRFLVPEGAVWSFHRGREEPSPGLEWTTLDFDDSRWQRGASGIGGYSTQNPETSTSLTDQVNSFTTLYLRHVFERDTVPSPLDPALRPAASLPESAGIAPSSFAIHPPEGTGERIEKLFFGLRFEDGFVAYLNGREIARHAAGQPGERLSCDALASRVIDYRQDFLSRLDASLLAPGRNVLAVQGLTHTPDSLIFLLPILAAATAPDEARDRSRTERLPREGGGAPVLAVYRQGRLFQRTGKLDDAIAAFEHAASLDPASPEPLLRRLECHRLLGELEWAESVAREKIAGGKLIDDGGVWAAWLVSRSHGPRRPWREELAVWPEAHAGAGSHGSTFRAVAEQLAGSGVRINCGGPVLSSASGRTWWADRFFASGAAAETKPRSAQHPVDGTEDDGLYRNYRLFPGARQLRPGYSVPIIPGRYRVSLHFAEVTRRQPMPRVFTVLLERKVVLEAYEPLSRGFAAAGIKTVEVDVDDCVLDLDFLSERSDPMISALEIERVEE